MPVTVVSTAVALGVLLWWRTRRPEELPPVLPDDMAITPVADDVPEAPEPQPGEGPGQLLLRFQALNKDFEHATKELQRYNGSREAQLQGWQQLASDVIRRILPVLDNLEPYLDDADTAAADVAQLAYGRLLTELVTIGVTQIIPSPGEPFNGKYHVLGPNSEGYPPYRVKSVVSPGYQFQPRIPGASEIVLKPAEVIVESDVVPQEEERPEETPAEIPDLERMAAAMALDVDDVIEIRRMPAPDDDDEDGNEIRRMPAPLPDED